MAAATGESRAHSIMNMRGLRHLPLPAVILLVSSLVLGAACGCSSAPPLTARQVLARAVRDMLSLETYAYNGTSSLSVGGDPRLDNKASFKTVLVKNSDGGLDGHMVVKSPSYSYETYGYGGSEYTRIEGGEWRKVARGEGYGLVSTEARDIIARFADLVEDVRIESRTSDTYTVSMVMGDRYRKGAAAIAGTAHGAAAGSGGGSSDIRMTLVVGRGDLRMRSVTMVDTSPASGEAPSFSIVTRGTYSSFNEPVDVTPPKEALGASEADSAAAPTTGRF